MAFKKVSNRPLIKWEEIGQELTGVYQGSKETDHEEYGKKFRHTLLTMDEQFVDFYAPTVLENLLNDNNIKPGMMIRIVFESTQKASRKGMNDYKVFTLEIDDAYSTTEAETVPF
jgi:hypothetical protein